MAMYTDIITRFLQGKIDSCNVQLPKSIQQEEIERIVDNITNADKRCYITITNGQKVLKLFNKPVSHQIYKQRIKK